MFLIYFFIVFPTNLILKILNKDILDLTIHKKKDTYWKKKKKLKVQWIINFNVIFKRIFEIFANKKKILVIANFNCFINFWRINCFNTRNCFCSLHIYNILKFDDINTWYICLLS